MWQRIQTLLFWTVLFSILIGVGIILWALFNQNTVDVITVIGVVTGLIIPVILALYSMLRSRSIRFFLFTNWLSTLLWQPAPIWEISASWSSSDFDDDIVDKICSEIVKSSNTKTKYSQKTVSSIEALLYIEPGPTLELSASYLNAGEPIVLHARARNYRVSYGHARTAITNEIIPIFELISRVSEVKSAKYSMKINFGHNKNPFLGLYIANIPEQIVSSFIVKLDLDDVNSRNQVTITDSHLAINTQSERALQNLALDFLSFNYERMRSLKHG